MLVFIDDSGDAGFKFEKGSTRYFIIGMVIFDDELEAEKTAIAIKELKRELKWSDQQEFKFFKTSKDIRTRFLSAVNPFKYKIRALVVDKSVLRSQELKKKEKFYSYFIKQALKHNGGSIADANIKIDGSGDRVFRKEFLGYLQRELNDNEKQVIKRCRMSDSASNVLIQLADMIAGSIHRSYNDSKLDSKLYKEIIKKHIEDIWEFR